MSGSEGYYNPYENEIGDIWWSESQTSHQKLSFRVRKLLHEEKTAYQHLLMLDTYQAGKLLALDNRVQLTEIDEFFYHESIVHPGLFSLNRDGLRVLIIGGGSNIAGASRTRSG
jgi:spermidine synthase